MTRPRRNRAPWLKIILLSAASLLSACNGQTVYHAYQSLPEQGWLRTDTLCFSVAVPDSLTYYRLCIEIRNRHDYPYRNLSLSVGCDTPAGTTPLPADTLQLTLADANGRWVGTGWSGLYQTSFAAGSIRIGSPGTYLLKIAYTLPDDVLQGINDVGIKLRK